MSFMPWSATFEFGIPEIDEQHRQGVAITNTLHDTILHEGARSVSIGPTLEKLVNYTQSHFTSEEALLEARGYGEIEEHKAEHDRFILKIIDLCKRHENEEAIALEMLEFLKIWLIHHICRVDRAYLPYFSTGEGSDGTTTDPETR